MRIDCEISLKMWLFFMKNSQSQQMVFAYSLAFNQNVRVVRSHYCIFFLPSSEEKNAAKKENSAEYF